VEELEVEGHSEPRPVNDIPSQGSLFELSDSPEVNDSRFVNNVDGAVRNLKSMEIKDTEDTLRPCLAARVQSVFTCNLLVQPVRPCLAARVQSVFTCNLLVQPVT
jgi:hypothetical protein